MWIYLFACFLSFLDLEQKKFLSKKTKQCLKVMFSNKSVEQEKDRKDSIRTGEVHNLMRKLLHALLLDI